MSTGRKERLTEFVKYVDQNITGDEKGEAQVYLDRLFKAFGRKGVREAGAVLEMRIKKQDNKGTAFADLVWKPIVLIEMKKRGENLAKHYRQAFDYWERLVPDRPRWVVLCNFDEFWVYDFNTQMDTPVDQLKIEELPRRYEPLNFLFPTGETPIFQNNQEAVTREAADLLVRCFNQLMNRKVERDLAQRFTLQMLVALFAEDIDLLPHCFVVQLLEDCKTKELSYDLIGTLFEQMNTPGKATGGRFKGVDYFNGGLFQKPAQIELYDDEINQLKRAAKADWSKVRPEIFGAIFEHSLDKEERHAFGAHFTYPADIMKIVGPTIVKPWREQIENTKNLGRLRELHQRMRTYTVLDPACGSGNFLYLAYRELKRLELRLHERIDELAGKKAAKGQRHFGFVTARQFFGIDINPFAIELAKVTMMIARKLAIDELHVDEPALPLDNLDANFTAADALIDDTGNPVDWPQTDVIIGNPPFLGAKRLKPERGADYVNSVRKAFPEVPGMADYCVYWIRRTHDQLSECTAADPLAGRAGLVGTQNIRNNKSRVGGLDYVVKGGTILEAVENQPWSGEANVHVSITNWVKTQDAGILPKERHLWRKVEPTATKNKRKRGDGPASKDFNLEVRVCDHINSTLSDQTDVSGAKTLTCNTKPQKCFQGVVPGYDGFLLDPPAAHVMLKLDLKNADVIHPFLIGRDIVTGNGKPSRYVIDLSTRDLLGARAYDAPFKHLKKTVLSAVTDKAKPGVSHDSGRAGHVAKWWEMWRPRPAMLKEIAAIPRFIVCSGVTKRPIFNFIHNSIRPDHAVFVFAFPDDYSFGILQSYVHWLWFITKCSKLKSDFRYTPPSVYDTFPWPQNPSAKKIDAVAQAVRDVRRIRDDALKNIKGGLRAVYRTLELPGKDPLRDAHVALSVAVLSVYGFSPKKDLLAQILALNLDVAGRIDRGESVVAPGVPPTYSNPENLITDDCIGQDAAPGVRT